MKQPEKPNHNLSDEMKVEVKDNKVIVTRTIVDEYDINTYFQHIGTIQMLVDQHLDTAKEAKTDLDKLLVVKDQMTEAREKMKKIQHDGMVAMLETVVANKEGKYSEKEVTEAKVQLEKQELLDQAKAENKVEKKE